MSKLYLLLFLTISLFANCDKGSDNNEVAPIELTGDLASAINQYRVSQGLSAIPVSPSLTLVAEEHVKDLVNNQPAQGNCNLHSWSGNGNWTACCYTDDHAQAQCMWDKPREMTNYTGNGYEIAAWSSGDISENQALEIWKNSQGHLNVIMNKDVWSNIEWKAIGAAIYKGYAVVWFGEVAE